jgi:hypothetical protein
MTDWIFWILITLPVLALGFLYRYWHHTPRN